MRNAEILMLDFVQVKTVTSTAGFGPAFSDFFSQKEHPCFTPLSLRFIQSRTHSVVLPCAADPPALIHTSAHTHSPLTTCRPSFKLFTSITIIVPLWW